MECRLTHSLYFASDALSRTGIPDRNRMMQVVKMGDKMATHSIPLMTLREMTKIPHHKTTSPKKFGCLDTFHKPAT